MRKKENEGGGGIDRNWWELGAKKGRKKTYLSVGGRRKG